MTTTLEETADALFASIETGDVSAVAALYADDVEVWHNFSNAVQNKAENLQILTALTQSVAQIRYEVKERIALDATRLLQRHELHCTTDGGEHFTIPACMLIAVREGRITRIDEYLDSAQANALRAASGRPAIER